MRELSRTCYRLTPRPPNLTGMRFHRTAVLMVGFSLVVAACGATETDLATPTEAAPATQQQTDDSTPATPVPTTQPSTAPSTSEEVAPAAERPAPDPNREIAPEFSLALGDGSTFVLSEETRPVFMVFWAEW